jgi:hypothetical protein
VLRHLPPALLILVGQHRRASQPLRFGRWGRVLLAVVLVAGVAGLIAVLTAGGASARKGCINVSVPSSTGGARIEECGAEARTLCANGPGTTGLPADALREGCASARIPVRF